MDRRRFLSSTVLATSPFYLADHARAEIPNAMKVALIGSGWYGMVNLRNLLDLTVENKNVEIVGLADPDQSKLKTCAAEVATKQASQMEPSIYSDYRKMLQETKPTVVIVGSPDHWHALHAIAAMEAGADVYCEKPICHTIDEGKAMLDTAIRTQRVVQIGTQRRSTPHVIRAREFIQSGKLGTIGQVKACCYYNMRSTENPKDTAPPDGFDFDLWTGPAPKLPFNPLFHPKKWRGFNEFSNGIVGDMFVHMFDTARFIMGIGMPKRVSSTGGIFVQKSAKANTTDTQTINLDYDNFTVQWDHRSYGQPDDPKYPWAVFFYGDKGIVKLDVEKWEYIPHWNSGGAKAFEDKADLDVKRSNADQPPHITPGGLGHMKNFLDCVSSRKKPVADIREGFLSTTACLLGNIALEVQRTLQWDDKTQTVKQDEPAQRLFRREYRQPWKYPEVTE